MGMAESFFNALQVISGCLRSFGSIVGLWAPATVAAVKTDINAFLVIISLVIILIPFLFALVQMYRIFANSFTQILTIIANQNTSFVITTVAVFSLVTLTYVSHPIIIAFLRFIYMLLMTIIHICGYTVGIVQNVGEIIGIDRPAIGN